MILYEKPLKIELQDLKLLVDGTQVVPSVRTFSELKAVLKEPLDNDADAYYMYRNVYKAADLRYDITLIPQWKAAEECAKTYGHCHPQAERKLSYPEVYQVLDGKAFFVLQKELRYGDFFVSVVEAKKGEVVLIPPNFCHTSINPNTKPLLLANIVADTFTSDYSMYKRNHGAAYYFTKEKMFVQNANYMINKNERVSAAEFNQRYKFEIVDLLAEFYASPDRFEFLKKPSLLKLESNDF